MRATVLKSICEVDRDEWNSIIGDNSLICRHEYLHAIEASQINDCRYFYPVVYEDGQIVAHACLYFISTELDTFATGLLKRTIIRARRAWKQFMILKSVECGTPVALGSTISFGSAGDRASALATIVNETEKLARELGVRVVLFRDFYDSELEFYDGFLLRGYKRINNLPGTKLGIRWSSFDEYLKTMRRPYRRRVLKQMEALKKPEICVEVLDEFSKYADDIVRLWENVYQNASEYRREHLGADFFRNIDQHLGKDSAVLLIRRNGIPVAFSLLLVDGDTLVPLFGGLDYSHNEEYSLYFNTLSKAVEIAIERGMREVDFGITTLIPKKELGAEVVPLHMYMKHLNPVLNRIIPRLFAMMTPQDTSHEMNVMKIG